MDGERLGRLSLRADAVYCLILGITLLIVGSLVPAVSPEAAVEVGTHVLAPSGVGAGWVSAIGILVAAWGMVVAQLERRRPLRQALTAVLVANVVAALALGAVSALIGGVLLTATLAALALDVAAFAVSQGVALGRQPG